MKKVLKYGLLPLVVIVLAIYVYKSLNLITGFAAKSTCSCTFEGKRDLSSIESGDNDIFPVRYANNKINLDEKSVTSDFLGLNKRTAVYKKEIGCVLVPKDYKKTIDFKPNRNFEKINLPYPYGDLPQNDTLFNNVNYKALSNAVSNAFDVEGEQLKRTRAVLVLHKDQIIAEKYAKGFSKESQLLGWSMTKSINSAIIGILEKQGKLSLEQSNLFPEWEKDERSTITLNNLLQMNSGLEWVENYNRISDVTRMLYFDEDVTKTQLEKELVSTPNNSWNYSSGTTNLLSRIARMQFKTHQEYLDFWYTALIDKIGMHTMVLETDVVGNYIGSSYSWATARDWAKFGLLYLNEGNWNGEQILTPEWVKYTAEPTNTSNGIYGAQFWLNAGGVYPNVSKDLYSCNGYQGQYVFIIPSKNLVVVRFGLAKEPGFNIDTFLSEIIASIE